MAVSLLGALLALQAAGPAAAQAFREQTTYLLGTAAQHENLPTALLTGSAVQMVSTVPAFLGVAVAGALIGSVSQVGLVFASQAAKPKLSNLSPKRGLERFKPGPALWELFRSSAKLGLLAVLLIGPVRGWMDAMAERRGLQDALGHAHGELLAILWRVVILAAVIAAADYAWNRWRVAKKLRMTKEEVKREHKEQEGDPHIRAARRQKALAFSRNRMIANVGTADVVVTNPTHLAVALVYEPDGPAPKVVAKGADRMAAKIRREAYRHGVVVTEDKPLARELYRRCKVGSYVPATLFEAVALVLASVYRRRPQKWASLFGVTAGAAGTAPADAGGLA